MSDASCQYEKAIAEWTAKSVQERATIVGRLRHVIAEDPDRFIRAITIPHRRDAVETLAAELAPLADACHFLTRNAARILRTRRVGARGRPLWLWGVASEVRREPFGRVLIIAPANYPLMLCGIQTIQALIAGNAVMLKPAPGCSAVARTLVDGLYEVGVPREIIKLLDENPENIGNAFDVADKVVLTGSRETGRAVLGKLTGRLTPSVMELSGCDAVFVRPDADVNLAARCLAFGLSLNNSATCMAPRRVFVDASVADSLIQRLKCAVSQIPALNVPDQTARRVDQMSKQAVEEGAVIISSSPLILDRCAPAMRILHADLMAPVLLIVQVHDETEAIRACNACEYRLGATIFGETAGARKLAERLNVGGVIINDMIAPSADPRLPFGGRGDSGFGVTRGEEGLLEMTRPKTIIVRRGGPMPYLKPTDSRTEQLLRGYLGAVHSRRWRERAKAMLNLVRASRATTNQFP